MLNSQIKSIFKETEKLTIQKGCNKKIEISSRKELARNKALQITQNISLAQKLNQHKE